MARIEFTATGTCERCGEDAHDHEKERVYTEGGKYHYQYYCEGE